MSTPANLQEGKPFPRNPVPVDPDGLDSLTDRLRQAALEYVGQGYRLIPIRPGAKTPIREAWEQNTISTPEDVEALYADGMPFNLALCPDHSRWAVVDVDPGADISNLELPDTQTVTTPRGGKHLYYAGSLPPTAGKLGKHIDTRGQHSYVLLPPSMVDGKPYVLSDARDPAPLPESIAAAVRRTAEAVGARDDAELDSPTDINSARALLRSYVKRGQVAISGQGGNNFTYQVAAKLVRDFSLTPATSLELMLGEWNEACVPPWSRDELAAIVTNALNYGQNEPGSFATRPAGETFAQYIETHAAKEPESKAKPFLMGLADVFELPDPKPLVDGFIMQRENACLYGAPKLGKSFVALDVGLSVATGLPAFGERKVHLSGPVIYLTAEGKSGFKKRIAAWAKERGITDIKTFQRETPFFFRPSVPLTSQGADEAGRYCAEIINQLGRKPALVILDTKAKSMRGLNENDNSHAEQFLAMMEDIIELLGCATLTLAHSGKEPGRGQRGASAATAGFEAVWLLDGNKETGALKLIGEDMKDAKTGEAIFLQRYDVNLPGAKSQAVRVATEAEHKRAKNTPERNTQMERVAIRNALREDKAESPDKGCDLKRMAVRLAGKPPTLDASRAEQLEYKTQVAQWVRTLKEGTRTRNPGKGRATVPPAFAGLFSLEDYFGTGELVPVFWMKPTQLDLNGAAYAARTNEE